MMMQQFMSLFCSRSPRCIPRSVGDSRGFHAPSADGTEPLTPQHLPRAANCARGDLSLGLGSQFSEVARGSLDPTTGRGGGPDHRVSAFRGRQELNEVHVDELATTAEGRRF